MFKTAEATIQKFKMLKKKDRVVIAVSGGPDSVALAYLLIKLKKHLALFLHLAHLNHMLRDGEAEEDCIFVQKLAKRLSLPLTCESLKVKDFAKQAKLSVEEAARKVRYDFLLKVARKNCANKIALGHNRDDQAETVLMRFLRGSGVSGLGGIPATRKLSQVLIIRPLIETTRDEVIHFLKAKDIAYRSDSSNLQDVYLRNRIRNQLLPYLEKSFNPNIKEMLVNFAENISEDSDYLQQRAQNSFKAARTDSGDNGITISLKKLLALHKALQKLVVRCAIKEVKGDVRRIDYRHWKELENLAQQRPQKSIVDLPGEVSVVKSKENLVFYKRAAKSTLPIR